MTEKNEKNVKTTDPELADLGKIYGVKETLDYVRGLNMENTGEAGLNTDAGELTRDQTDGLEVIEYQPHCDREFGDFDKKEKQITKKEVV